MKHLLLLFCTIVILSFESAGQDYQLFPPGRTMFFNNLEYAFQPDSIWYEGDQQIVQNYKSPLICDQYYADTTDLAWLSHAYTYDSLSNKYQFLSRDFLLFQFYHGTQPGDIWEFSRDSTFYIEAHHIYTDTMSILGELDSVKVIRLQVFDSTQTPVDNQWSEAELIISQHHGVVKFFNVDEFPETYSEVILTGITQPDLGETGLTKEDFNTFQVGDELHYIYSEYYTAYRQEDYIILLGNKWRFLKDLGDQQFEIERKIIRAKKNLGRNMIDTTFINDTISMKFPEIDGISRMDPLIDMRLPAQQTPIGFISYDFDSTFQRINKKLNLGDSIGACSFYGCISSHQYNYFTDCWEPNFNRKTYYMFEGIGMLFYKLLVSGSMSEETTTKELIYFKNSEDSWGDTLDFNRLWLYSRWFKPTNPTNPPDSVNQDDSFLLYPNQIHDRFRISLPSDYKNKNVLVKIDDLSGRTVFSSPYVQQDEYLTLPTGFPNGYYIAKIFLQDQLVHLEKIMKY